MKKKLTSLWAWICGPKSDVALFLVALVLLNLVAGRAFVRIDLTAQGSYSLSRSSVEVIKSLDEPLAIKVFFTEKLPAPYNSVERYLRDLLVEYSGVGSKKFSFEFFDMDKEENQKIASSYGLSLVQVEEYKDNEVGIKNGWMGLAIVYRDRIETLDRLQTPEGLEYRITTTISRMIATTSSLAGLSDTVKLRLYISPELAPLNIEKRVFDAYNAVNRKNMDRLEYQGVDPAQEGVDALAARYGFQKIPLAKDASGEITWGLLGLVLEYQDRFRVIPLRLAQSIFGGYSVVGIEALETGVSDALTSLMSSSLSIGYVTGHGEVSLTDEQQGLTRLVRLASDMYTFVPVNPDTEDIPPYLSALMINGPTQAFSEAGLYRIDQFLLRGGNLFVLKDPFEQIPSPQAQYGAEPQYLPITSGLERLLEKWGVSVGHNYVLDKNCYQDARRGGGSTPLYYVPQLQREGMNARHPVSRNLAYVFFVQSAAIETLSSGLPQKVTMTDLATSSPESWVLSDRISLAPWAVNPPGNDSLASERLAVSLEGFFPSAFSARPAALDAAEGTEGSTIIHSQKHLDVSVLPSRVILMGSSRNTTPIVIDEQGRQPTAIFIRNCLDYVSGRDDLPLMRTKGLAFNTLDKTSAASRALARAINLWGLPVLAGICGLIAWRVRNRRRKVIKARYSTENREVSGGKE